MVEQQGGYITQSHSLWQPLKRREAPNMDKTFH